MGSALTNFKIHAIHPLPASLSEGGTPGYLDIVPSKEGYNHIAIFNPVTSTTPQYLTSGEWEVTEILAVDPNNSLVYAATHLSPF